MPIGQYGWCDEVGPLWFLRPRWSCGSKWRPCWARFYAGQGGVALQAHTKKGGYAVDGCFLSNAYWQAMGYGQKETYVMSWIKSVRVPGSNGDGPATAVDGEWMRDWPAIHDYLTVQSNPDGSGRRVSTLTVFSEHGAWKLFLNERDAGASLCATGPTIGDALSALEVMLEGDNPPWRFSGTGKAENGKKAKRGT